MYTANYTDPQLFDPQVFENALNTSKNPIPVFRATLTQSNEVLKARFQGQYHANKTVIQRAWLIDQILLQAWRRYPWSHPDQIALIAVGGYGRGELHPFSDVDLTILLKETMDEQTKQHIEAFIMFLWDIRLEVGHSVRTLAECEKEAAKDITIMTNLIEARLLTGPVSLFHSMQAITASDKMWSTQDFFAAKVWEQNQRHHKYHDTAYNLEPNLKEGIGGLRDIQTIGWVAKRHFGATTLYDLVQHNFLTEDEYSAVIQGQEFLWRIRCFLHTEAKRREDRLLFDYQRTLASTFGYEDSKSHLAVEGFMKQYYRTAMEISGLNEMLLQLFEEVILYGNRPTTLRPLNKRFQVRNDFIEVVHDQVFMHYPFALLEIFLLMQQHPEIKGVRASTIRLIRQYKFLIDDAFHQDLRVRSLFFEIFRQAQGLTHALRRMNRYGILAAYIPEFGRIVGQMQYDLFHVYTVDQHSLFVVSNLRRFSLREYDHELPLCSKVKKLLPKPELLYLAGLFHDIAKGRGGDHSLLGEVDTLHFCQAHGLSDYDSRFVAWLVRQHLFMSTTAQRQDISDPDVINAFAQKVRGTTRLDYLYLLTVADIRATNPNLWNTWKDALLAKLYHKTKDVLEKGLDNVIDRQERIQNIQAQVRVLLQDIEPETIEMLWQNLDDEYFLRPSYRDLANEMRAILRHGDNTEPLLVKRRDTRGSTEFMVYTQDNDYLFAEITFFLDQHDLTVVSAYIVRTQNNYTINTFNILDKNNELIQPEERIEAILNELQITLTHEGNALYCPINRRISRQLKHFPVPTRITFTQDESSGHTLMEIITTDRPGVLSCIAQSFVMCNVRVKKANIATFGSRVEDIFYITDSQNYPLYSASQIDCVREHLSILLEVEVPAREVLTI